MFHNFVLAATPDLNNDPFAQAVYRAEHLSGAAVMVFSPAMKRITAAYGEGNADEITAALDKWVCAFVNDASPLVPAAYAQQSGPACKSKAQGISSKPEVLNRR
jgi:hypothetical protein